MKSFLLPHLNFGCVTNNIWDSSNNSEILRHFVFPMMRSNLLGIQGHRLLANSNWRSRICFHILRTKDQVLTVALEPDPIPTAHLEQFATVGFAPLCRFRAMHHININSWNLQQARFQNSRGPHNGTTLVRLHMTNRHPSSNVDLQLGSRVNAQACICKQQATHK